MLRAEVWIEMGSEKEGPKEKAKTSGAAGAIEVDSSQNLVVIRYHGWISVQDAERYLEEARAALAQMQPGFRLLVDLTYLESMESAVALYIEKIMDLLNEKGVTRIVRVIPDPARDIGFQIMSLFHYGQDVAIVTCATLEDAKNELARDN